MTAASAAQPVTGKQVSFMGTLIAERSDDNVAKAFAAAGIDQTAFSPTDCSKGEASALISALLDTPKMKKGQKAAAPVSTASAQIAFGSDVPPAAVPVTPATYKVPAASGIVGKEFFVTVADGVATYVVTADDGEFATVEWVPNAVNYMSNILGTTAKISRANVVAAIPKAV